MFKNLKISYKIFVIFLMAGLLPILAIAGAASIQSRSTLLKSIFQEIEIYQKMKEKSIADYMDKKTEEGWTLSKIARIYNAVNDYNTYGADSDEWTADYAVIENFIQSFADEYELYSVYVTGLDKSCIYCSGDLKKAFENTSLSGEEYIQTAMSNTTTTSKYIYSPELDDYYMVVSVPLLLNGTGEVIGTINMLILISTIQDMLQDGIDILGKTANVYTVNEAGLLYSNTTNGAFADNKILSETIDSVAVRDLSTHIVAGEDDYLSTSLYKDYEGIPVVGGYGVMNLGTTHLGFITEIYQSDILAGLNQLIAFMIGLTLFALIIAVALIFLGSRSITTPIKNMVAVSKKLAKGDLDINLTSDRKDETGELASAIEAVIENTNMVLTSINKAADQVERDSHQVLTMSTNLSHGAMNQASAVEQLSSAVAEIASQLKFNTKDAEDAKCNTKDAKSYVEKGYSHMKEMMNAMEEISTSSTNISKIIKVIDDIAFQTNILALNAAVEAARAGDKGKGFAVVADEVRNLAVKSANAAKGTTDMIESSIKKVVDGTRIVKETATAFQNIGDAINGVDLLVEKISISSKEQSLSIDQINLGISQISDVVQTTSATAQETASASEELTTQSELLKTQVASFHLKKIK